MKKNPTVFILCGVHNEISHTKQLLACIRNQSYPNLQTVIVDDGSNDGTENYFRKYHPRVTLLLGNGTLWWTGSIAKGVTHILKKAKKRDFILTVNNDCTFKQDYLSILEKVSSAHNRAIVGSLVVDRHNSQKIIDAGIRISWMRGKFIGLGPTDINDMEFRKRVRFDIDTVTTKGTLYPVEVFKTIGNFDAKHLPHYLSDYEFGIRAKRAGFTVLLSFDAYVYNDSKRTGIGAALPERMSFSNAISFLTSRRSKRNIFDLFWFITLSCPFILKPLNYILLLLRSLYVFLKVI